ncbi:MAG: nucleotidyltransferase family protein, partial [Deltaproteobacteria bacterium]|nr:nucleotidyltransferase family protein [Deltaproteobacteria bacterium]
PRSRWEKGVFRIDLHFDILDEDRLESRRYIPRIPVEEIFTFARTGEIGEAQYLSPNPYHSLIITALHALKHAYVMDYWFMDTGTIMTEMGKAFSMKELLKTADRYGHEKVVHIMLWALQDLFQFSCAKFSSNAFLPGPLVRRCVKAATEHTRFLQFGTFLMGTTIDSFWKKLHYFVELAGPKRAVLIKERGQKAPLGRKSPGLGLHGERFMEFFQSLAMILKG